MIDDYHGERKMILNENDSRAISSWRITVDKSDTKESQLYFLFQIVFIWNVAINIYGNRDDLVLIVFLLNTQLNFLIRSFNYFILFICFIKQFVGSIW